MRLPKDLRLMVYDYATMSIRTPLPFTAEVSLSHDATETSFLRTCKLIRDEARTIFDRSRRSITPVLTFDFSDDGPTAAYCLGALQSRRFIRALLIGTSILHNGQNDPWPLRDFVRYERQNAGACPPNLVAHLRPLYLTTIRHLVAGETLQVRILLRNGATTDQTDAPFWQVYTGDLNGERQTPHFNMKLIFVTPLETTTVARKQLVPPAQTLDYPFPSYEWAVEEGGVAERD
jgi:hypothetical protein